MAFPHTNTITSFMILLGLFFYSPTVSQEILRLPTGSLSDSLQISTLSFDRFLNTFIWDGSLRVRQGGELWDVNIDQLVRSRLIKTEENSIQDEYQGAITLRAKLSENWHLQVQNMSQVLADNRIIDLGKMAQHQFLGGAEYSNGSLLSAGAFSGYELSSQESEHDNGFAYMLNLDARQMKVEEFIALFHSTWNQSYLGRRSPRSGGVSLVLMRDFGNGVDDSLVFNYSDQKREFYTSMNVLSQMDLGIQHNIFFHETSEFDVKDQLHYNIGGDLSFVITGGLVNKLINRGYTLKDYQNPASLILDSRILELQLYGNILLRWSTYDWLNTDIMLAYIEREERHSIQEDAAAPVAIIESQRSAASRLENAAQRTVLSLGLKSDFTQDDVVHCISSASILRYDTPDTLNVDDRDELLLTLGAEEVHRFSSHLLLTLNADITLFHLVYLDRLQSANNNWNRVLKFSPRIEYTPSFWFSTMIEAEVLANYTVSDYEEQVASVKSYSLRQAFWSDSTVMRLGERIKFKFIGNLRIYERGTLRWQEFKEHPENYFVEKVIWPEIIWSSGIGLNIGVGFRYFGQDRYNYNGTERTFDSRLEALGPTVLMDWAGSGHTHISVAGWREIQKINGTTTASISNLSMKIGFIL